MSETTQPDIAGLGSDEIDADYLSELRTSRNRWRREAKDLRAEVARLREENASLRKSIEALSADALRAMNSESFVTLYGPHADVTFKCSDAG